VDRLSSFTDRLGNTWPYLLALFCGGFAIAVWDPYPKLILTVALGISTGMLLLGPYAAAALYTTRLQRVWGGHLRWPICLMLALSAVVIMDYFLIWRPHQIILAGITTTLGSILGHDATLAVLELRAAPGATVDAWMVILFPTIVGLAVLAGYCSLGFGVGTYHFALAIIR